MFGPSIQPRQQVYALASLKRKTEVMISWEARGLVGLEGQRYGTEAVREGVLGGSARAGIKPSIWVRYPCSCICTNYIFPNSPDHDSFTSTLQPSSITCEQSLATLGFVIVLAARKSLLQLWMYLQP
jgi:hypothetical protein